MKITTFLISCYLCLLAVSSKAQDQFYLRSKSDTTKIRRIKAVESVSVPFSDSIDQIEMFVNLEKQIFSDSYWF